MQVKGSFHVKVYTALSRPNDIADVAYAFRTYGAHPSHHMCGALAPMVLGFYISVWKGRIGLSVPISVWNKVLNDSLKILKTLLYTCKYQR